MPGGPKHVATVDDVPPEMDLIFQGLLEPYTESYLNLNEMDELTSDCRLILPLLLAMRLAFQSTSTGQQN